MSEKHTDYCERCGEKLNPKTMVWLELNSRTGLYSDPDKSPVPEEDSQGGFTFGKACAAAVLKNGGRLVRLAKK
jgi:hypothetical protein